MFNTASQAHFSLAIDNVEHDLQVLAFTGTEGISRPYAFDVELVSERSNLALETLLHKQAFLSLGANGKGIHGQIYRIAQSDTGKRLARYCLTLVPQLSYLKHRSNQRIYQQMSVPNIIALILDEHGIRSNAYSFQLSQPCPDRDYCVQYDETDLHFVQRLCEEEGIHYHFQHSEKAHLLVFGDHQAVFPKLGQPTAYVQGSGMVADEPVINAFQLRLETRTHRATRRDYNFEKPRLLLESACKPEGESTEPDLEDYDYPGRFIDRARGKFLCQLALQRHRADYQQAEGHSDQATLTSGHFLQLSDHPRQAWNDLWLLTEVFHEGKQPQVLEESVTSDTTSNEDDFHQGYRNRFLATPWAVFYRPALEHPKPRVLGSQTALVTGPEGEEVHCDPYGRIKVQFHWDREGRANDKTSCWLRVSSSWAGDHYGAITIPRVGMEVLVSFLEGDPDQPVVTGCLYHQEHQVPYSLPGHKTRSVFKTLSSPGGGGYNELRIEDKKGAEQIYLHAQRDWDENIEHDQRVRVGNERHGMVENNTYTELKAEEHRTTTGDRKVEVKADDHLVVGQNQHIKLGSAQLIEAGNEIHLKAGQKMVVEAGMELTVKAGGSFIRLDAGGISVVGPVVKLNAGGAAGVGTASAALLPQVPRPAASDTAGAVPELRESQPAPEVIHTLSATITAVPGHPGYEDEPYTLFADGAVIQEGLTGEHGVITFDHVPGTQAYAVELVNGHRFEIEPKEASGEASSNNEQLARQGYRDYQGQGQQVEPLGSPEDYRSAPLKPADKPTRR
jgi:type VI secretion system secreted protein VgrG